MEDKQLRVKIPDRRNQGMQFDPKLIPHLTDGRPVKFLVFISQSGPNFEFKSVEFFQSVNEAQSVDVLGEFPIFPETEKQQLFPDGVHFLSGESLHFEAEISSDFVELVFPSGLDVFSEEQELVGSLFGCVLFIF